MAKAGRRKMARIPREGEMTRVLKLVSVLAAAATLLATSGADAGAAPSCRSTTTDPYARTATQLRACGADGTNGPASSIGRPPPWAHGVVFAAGSQTASIRCGPEDLFRAERIAVGPLTDTAREKELVG